ncbi:MAG TPA: hypothetical protein PKM78_01855 [Anaerolineae bacterium]|nr:hypothetical protein [Anaerolineae bacterium]HNU02661.1 hypothetical protein [Anaerolineae bacterium]
MTSGSLPAPGKLCAAFAAHLAPPELAALVERMAAALGLPAGHRAARAEFPGGAVAGPAWAAVEHPALTVVCAGRAIGASQAARTLDRDLSSQAGLSDLALAGALLHQHRGAALQRLTGVFSLISARRDAPQVVIANDRLGFSPLYYLLQDDLLLVASEVKAIAAVADVRPDPAGHGQFFYIGHLLRHHTLWREIKALGPGQLIAWQPQGAAVCTYFDPARQPQTGATPAPLDAIHDALQNVVARIAPPANSGTLLLSGGMDSRLILATLLSQGIKPRALSLEHAGFAQGLDGLLARQVAEVAGLELDFRPTRPHFYQSADALEVFCLADGATPSFGLFISQVYPELSAELGWVWEGLSLDLCLGGQHQTGATLRSNLPELLASRRANRRFLRQLLQRDWFEQIERSFEQELAAELERFPDSEDGWIRFQMVNRKRRRVGLPPHQIYGRKVLALTPGVDADFVEFMWSTPVQQRQQYRLYAQLLLRCQASLAGPEVLTGERRTQIESIAQAGIGAPRRFPHALRGWVKGLGLAPYARDLQARLGGVERVKVDSAPPSVVIGTLRATGFDRPFYRRAQIEQWLARAERGSVYWLHALLPVFYMELWHCLHDPAALAALRQTVFVGGQEESVGPALSRF